MTKINNPRFPHHCRILRYAATEPMEDQPNVSDYDPMADDPLADETDETDGESLDGETAENTTQGVTVVYEGVCRSDNHYQTTGSGDVNVSYRTLSLPKKQDEWSDADIPREGDNVKLQRFGYKEYGIVIDVKPSNLGTHLYWKYVRN